MLTLVFSYSNIPHLRSTNISSQSRHQCWSKLYQRVLSMTPPSCQQVRDKSHSQPELSCPSSISCTSARLLAVLPSRLNGKKRQCRKINTAEQGGTGGLTHLQAQTNSILTLISLSLSLPDPYFWLTSAGAHVPLSSSEPTSSRLRF